MDPTAIFVHKDRRAQTLAQSTWQKVGIDRVTQVSFDATGRLCAIYYATNAIELWDFSSIPVPMSSLVLPKLASGRYDGFCYSLTWSLDNTQLIGVFGSRAINRVKSAEDVSPALSNPNPAEMYRPYQMVVWDVRRRVTTHMLRLPFGVKNVQALGAEKYILASIYGNCLFELSLQDSTIRELTFSSPAQDGTTFTASQAFPLYNTFATENLSTEGPTTACDVSIDAFAAHWFEKCASFNDNPHLIETIATSALAVDLSRQVIYYSQHDTTNPCQASLLHKVDCSTSTYTILATTALHLHCPVLALSIDPQTSLLCVAGTNGQIKLYSTDLALLGDQLPSDRELTDILNTQASVSTKQHFPGTGRTQSLDHKKVLPVTYSANTEYKCMGVVFYTYTVPYSSDNTRYSNNLTHHDLLYPDTTACNYGTTTATATTSNSVHKATQRTGLLYSVQGHSKINVSGAYSEHLILFDLDVSPTPTVSTSPLPTLSIEALTQEGATSDINSATPTTVTAPKRLLCKGLVATALPKVSVAEFVVSPLQTTIRHTFSNTVPPLQATQSLHPALKPTTTVTTTVTTSGSTLPKQTVLSIDEFGRLWSLRPHYKSDFPGPMYPIGYTLINKVVQYVETEEELDVVVPNISDSANHGTSGSDSVSVSMSKDSLIYSNNSSKRDFSEAFEATTIPIASTTTTHNSAVVTDLVLPTTSTISNSISVAQLPFTFADDFLRSLPTNGNNNIHANPGAKHSSAVNGVRRGLESVSSPLRARPDMRNVYSLASPEQTNSNVNSTVNATSSNANTSSTSADLHYDPTLTTFADNNVSDNTSTEPVAAVWAVEDFLNLPVRIQSGDFESKLARNATAAELIRHTLSEPERVKQKITQIQEEAVAALRHAQEIQERKLARNAAKKLEKEEEKRKEREKQTAERAKEHALTAQLALQQQASQAPPSLPLSLPPSLQPSSVQRAPTHYSPVQMVVSEAQLQAQVAMVKAQNPGQNVSDEQWRAAILENLQKSGKKIILGKATVGGYAGGYSNSNGNSSGYGAQVVHGNGASGYGASSAHLMHTPHMNSAMQYGTAYMPVPYPQAYPPNLAHSNSTLSVPTQVYMNSMANGSYYSVPSSNGSANGNAVGSSNGRAVEDSALVGAPMTSTATSSSEPNAQP